MGNFLTGLAAGLKSGVDAYIEQSRYADKQRQGEEALDIQAAQAGYDRVRDENTRTVRLVPKAATLHKQAYDQGSYDPASPVSLRARNANRAVLNQVKTGLGDQTITEDMSKAEIDALTKEGLIGRAVTGIYGANNRQVTAGLMRDRNDVMRESLGLRRDAQAAQAANVFDKDENLRTLQRQRQNVQRGKHTLEGVQILTPQLLNEIQLDIANAISGGRSAAVSTQNKAEFHSLEMDFTQLQQRLTNRPQDIGSPEVKAYIADVLDRLDSAYAHNMAERAQQLSVGRDYKHNVDAKAAVDAKLNSYQIPQEQPGLVTERSQEDLQAIEWARQNPNDPRSKHILEINGVR